MDEDHRVRNDPPDTVNRTVQRFQHGNGHHLAGDPRHAGQADPQGRDRLRLTTYWMRPVNKFRREGNRPAFTVAQHLERDLGIVGQFGRHQLQMAQRPDFGVTHFLDQVTDTQPCCQRSAIGLHSGNDGWQQIHRLEGHFLAVTLDHNPCGRAVGAQQFAQRIAKGLNRLTTNFQDPVTGLEPDNLGVQFPQIGNHRGVGHLAHVHRQAKDHDDRQDEVRNRPRQNRQGTAPQRGVVKGLGTVLFRDIGIVRLTRRSRVHIAQELDVSPQRQRRDLPFGALAIRA